MKKYIIVLPLLLGACMHRSPQVQLYTLPSGDMAKPVSNMNASIDIGRICIPEYLDRAQIVTIDGTNVVASQTNRWAENISQMLHRNTIERINHYLPNATVKPDNFMAESGDYTVFIEIYKIDGALGDAVKMDAVYSITDAASEQVALETVHYSTTVGDSYSDYAAGVGKLSDKLAHDISVKISSIADKK